MIRAIIKSVVQGVIQRFSADGRTDESFDDREFIQHYGYTSRPLPGAEGIIILDGNHIVMIASDDRRYRIDLEEGEVALYTDEGDKIHLKRNREIEIIGGNKVTVTTKVAEINAETSATVTSPVFVVNASDHCQVNSPMINLGDDRASLHSLIDERLISLFNNHDHGGHLAGAIDGRIVTLFNSHVHAGPDLPPTGQINTNQCYTNASPLVDISGTLTQANCCTTVTKAK